MRTSLLIRSDLFNSNQSDSISLALHQFNLLFNTLHPELAVVLHKILLVNKAIIA